MITALVEGGIKSKGSCGSLDQLDMIGQILDGTLKMSSDPQDSF